MLRDYYRTSHYVPRHKFLLNEGISFNKIFNTIKKTKPDINIDELSTLLVNCPTYIKNNNGQFIDNYYGYWVAKLYKDGKLNTDENTINRLNFLLGIYHKNKSKKLSPLNTFNSLDELEKFINENGLNSSFIPTPSNSKKSKCLVYEDDFYKVYEPDSFKIERQLGGDTHWCTASSNGECIFDDYIQNGPLFVIISKETPTDKYQLHVENKEFRDRNDSPVTFDDLRNNSKGVIDFLRNDRGYGYKLFRWIPKAFNEELPYLLKKEVPLDYLYNEIRLEDVFDDIKGTSIDGVFLVTHNNKWNILKNDTLLLDKWVYDLYNPSANSYGIVQKEKDEPYQVYHIEGNETYIVPLRSVPLDEIFDEVKETSMKGVYIVVFDANRNILKDGNLLINEYTYLIDGPNSNGYGMLQKNLFRGWSLYHIEGDGVKIGNKHYSHLKKPNDSGYGEYRYWGDNNSVNQYYQIEGNKVYDVKSGKLIDEFNPVRTTISEQRRRINRIVQEVLNEYIIRNY